VANPYLPPIQPYHPTTFLERGVAVPFTTPLLEGTRVRPAEKHGVELVVPNPSGGRGAYIVPWTGIDMLCRPTLHDVVLNDRISGLTIVTPATIRRSARALATEGLAGEDAMQAALKAVDEEKEARTVTNYQLLMELVAQVNLDVPNTDGASGAIHQERRAKATIAWVAPRLGRSTGWVPVALEALADVFGHLGVGAARNTARIPRLVNLLRTAALDIQSKSRGMPEDQVGYAQMICAVAEHTLSLSDTIIGKARGLTENMVNLLRTWGADPDSVVRTVSRPEWLLDGWEQICRVWLHAADEAARRAALAEIATLVPVIPREANEWCENVRDVEHSLRFRRVVSLNEDWRSGATVFDLIARNEQFRAVAL
jgi:hypothetical protein